MRNQIRNGIYQNHKYAEIQIGISIIHITSPQNKKSVLGDGLDSLVFPCIYS